VKLTFPTIDHATAIIVIIVVIYLVIALWLMWKQNVSQWSVVIATYVVSFLVLVLWWVPKVQVSSLPTKGVKAEDVFKAENDARATLAQIIGGFAVLTGLYFAWRNITTTAKNLELTKEGQVTDRFNKAIEQLGATDNDGKPKLELRLGGIYALERIARDSERDHWPIMEVLTAAYVREHTPAHLPANQTNPVAQDPATLATDIHAIVTVIHRREWNYEKGDQRLDLHGTYLHGADLRDTNLARANLTGAYLIGAYLMSAYLKDTQGVTQDRIDSAMGDATTKLPVGIVMPESWKKKAP
jgi:Pentapeptide repeats (8 copies)